MKYLVTGGDGFIGFNFVNQLNLNNKKDISKVYIIDNFSLNKKCLNLNKFSENSKFEIIDADISDYEIICEVVSEVDFVVNFAAESHVDRSIVSPMGFFKSNIIGVATILEAIRNSSNKARLLQVSTDEVYGSLDSGTADEEFKLRPNSPYSSSKASADLICRAYAETYNLDIVISRSCNNYGPYQNPEKAIPNFISKAITGKPIEIYGDGTNVREWVHVDDTVKGLNSILEKGRAGSIYNIGTGHQISNLDLARSILTELGISPDSIKFVKDRAGHDFRYSINSTKISTELDFSPKIAFKEGLKRTIDWYSSNLNWISEAEK